MSSFWPLETHPSDPYGDLHWEISSYGYKDYRAHGGTLNEADYDQAAGHYQSLIISGQTLFSDDTVEILRLVPPFLLPAVPPTEPYTPMGTKDIIRISNDYLPALGQDAPDLVLGPWSDELDLKTATGRGLMRLIMAIAGVETIMGSRFSGAEMWARGHQTPTAIDRARVRMVSDAPHSLWRIESVEDGRFLLTDLIGLDDHYLPDGPVIIKEPLSVCDCDGPYLLGRIGYTPMGWQAHLPLLLPAIPKLELIHTWLQREFLLAQLRVRKITLERLLRRRGHVLIRRLHEWLWLHLEETRDV